MRAPARRRSWHETTIRVAVADGRRRERSRTHSPACWREFTALAEDFLVPLRQELVGLVFRQRDQQPARREQVERLIEQIELQLTFAVGSDREYGGVEPGRQVPKVGCDFDSRGRTGFRELSAKPVGLVEVHLIADGFYLSETCTQVGCLGGRTEDDNDGGANACFD